MKNKQIELPIDLKIDDILGVLNAISIISDVKKFQDWLISFHHIKNNTELFEGYKFTYNVLTRRLHDELSENISLQLSQDFIFYRANFRGIEIQKLPNTCEKIILLKNIRKKLKPVLSCKNWEQITYQIQISRDEVINPLLQLKRCSKLSTIYTIGNIDDAINYSTINLTYIFLNDTRRGVPHGYYTSTLDNSLWHNKKPNRDAYLKTAFKGYKYTIQYLWFILLGEKFYTTSLVNMHRAKNWDDFDTYFEILREEVINPLENNTKVKLGMSPVLEIKSGAKHILKPLIKRKSSIYRPTKLERLERVFLWYEIELVDASQDTIFNGIPALIRSITGSVEIRRRNKVNEKTKIVRLIHKDDTRGSTYSYAVLMEVSGFISDASGWLLFFDCCYDYTGNGVSGLKYVEGFIDEYSKNSQVQVDEIRISKADFLRLMAPYLVSITKEKMQKADSNSKLLQSSNDRLATSKGMVLELLVYYLFSESCYSNENDIEWNYRQKELEIDVIFRNSTTIRLFECKKPLSGLIDECKKFKNKAQDLLKDEQFIKRWRIDDSISRILTIVVWDRPPKNILDKVIEQGMDILIFSEELKNNPRLIRKSKDKIEHIFNNIEAS